MSGTFGSDNDADEHMRTVTVASGEYDAWELEVREVGEGDLYVALINGLRRSCDAEEVGDAAA